jgi:hypothetical protein
MAFSGAILVASVGCDKESRPAATASLTNNDEIHNAMQTLIDAASSLQSDVADFDTEDWKEVVPNVRTAASDIETAVLSLKIALGYSE